MNVDVNDRMRLDRGSNPLTSIQLYTIDNRNGTNAYSSKCLCHFCLTGISIIHTENVANVARMWQAKVNFIQKLFNCLVNYVGINDLGVVNSDVSRVNILFSSEVTIGVTKDCGQVNHIGASFTC